MKPLLFILILVGLSNNLIAQVYGDLFMDKRKIAKEIDYTIIHSIPGKLVFNIVVDMDGSITSCVLDKNRSTLTSTVAMVKAKNKIIVGLAFERGYHFPKFHRGQVQIETVQGEAQPDKRFAPPN